MNNISQSHVDNWRVQAYQCPYETCQRVINQKPNETLEELVKRFREHLKTEFTLPFSEGLVFQGDIEILTNKTEYETEEPPSLKEQPQPTRYNILTGYNTIVLGDGYAHTFVQQTYTFPKPLEDPLSGNYSVINSKNLTSYLNSRRLSILSTREFTEFEERFKEFQKTKDFLFLQRVKNIKLIRTPPE